VTSLHADYGDGLHETATEDQQVIRTTSFNYDSIDEANGWHEPGEAPMPDSVSFSDMSACFILVLEWMLKGKTLQIVGGRCAALAAYLDPVNSNRFGTDLTSIAKSAGCSRAALSASLIEFRDAVSIHLSNGKNSEARASYRQTQIRAMEAGRHSSFSRKDLRHKKPA